MSGFEPTRSMPKSFSFEILDAGDFLPADDRSGHTVFALSDHHQIFSSSGNRPRRGEAADNPHVDFSLRVLRWFRADLKR